MPCSFLGCLCGKAILPQRFIMILLAALGLIVVFGQRVNLSLIITVMVAPKNKSNQTECGEREVATDKSGQYAWTEFQQQMLLAIFFIGYFINHIPGGYLADRYSARLVFTTCILFSSVLTILSPVAVTYTHYWVFSGVRFLIGIAQAPIFPSITTLMARWIPKQERAVVGGVIFAANSFGIILGSMLSGAIKLLFDTWESVFYFWGGIGVVWYMITMMFVYSEPATHPHISDKEKKLLEETIVKKQVEVKANWCAMLTDVPVWAMTAGQFGHAWMIFFLSTNMPKYYSDVLNFNMKKNTLVSSLPYILQWLSSVTSGKLGDVMIKKNWCSVAFVRKSWTTVASVIPSLCLLFMPYCGCNSTIVTVLLCVSLLTMGPFYCGLKVNVIDLTVNFSGLLMAFVNGLGAVAGFISPYVVGFLAPNNKLTEWKIVMWVMFGAASITNIIYIIWGSANRCKWDMMPDEWEVYKAKLDKEKADKKAKKQEKKEAKKAAKNAKQAERAAKHAKEEAESHDKGEKSK